MLSHSALDASRPLRESRREAKRGSTRSERDGETAKAASTAAEHGLARYTTTSVTTQRRSARSGGRDLCNGRLERSRRVRHHDGGVEVARPGSCGTSRRVGRGGVHSAERHPGRMALLPQRAWTRDPQLTELSARATPRTRRVPIRRTEAPARRRSMRASVHSCCCARSVQVRATEFIPAAGRGPRAEADLPYIGLPTGLPIGEGSAVELSGGDSMYAVTAASGPRNWCPSGVAHVRQPLGPRQHRGRAPRVSRILCCDSSALPYRAAFQFLGATAPSLLDLDFHG